MDTSGCDIVNVDIIIIGAGPAGLALAKELVNTGLSALKVLVLDAGPNVSTRIESRRFGDDRYNVTGIGGAGLFSDGKLHFGNKRYRLFPSDPRVFKLWDALPNPFVTEDETQDLYRYAYGFLAGLEIDIQETPNNEGEIVKLQNSFQQNDVLFLPYESRQIRPEYWSDTIVQLVDTLLNAGINFRHSTKVLEIEISNDLKYLKCLSGNHDIYYTCKYLVFAVGKIGARWLNSQAYKIGISKSSRPVEIGFRVEVDNEILNPIIAVQRDPQLIYVVNDNLMVQTFCTCKEGKVTNCVYDDLMLLGGYTDDEKTANTNFALVAKMNLVDIDALSYGFSVIKTVNVLGKGMPLVQRLGDLKKGVPSTLDAIHANSIKPTLKKYSTGNIALAFPKEIVDALLKTLATFDMAIPGVNHDDVIVSAPCLEFSHERMKVNKYMETNLDGIYVVGDAAGYENGIIPSMAGGILAARGIYEACKSHLMVRSNRGK